MKRGMFNRVVSLILAVTMVFTIGFDPTLVMAKEGDEGYVITGFTALERDVREQRLEVGSSESDIVFPKELKATIEHTEEVLIDMPETTDVVDDKNEAVAEEGANTDEITPSDTGDSQTDAASEENNEITGPKSEVTEPVVDNAPAEVAPEPTAEPAPVAEPTPATEPVSTPEPAPAPEPASTPEPVPAPEPASTPEPETGVDPVAFIIDSLFPSITAQAEELDESTPTEEPASEPTAEAPAVEPVEEPGEPAEQSTEQDGETVATSEPAIQVKPFVTTEEITIQGVTWTLDAENSSAPSFDGSILGAKYVYKPVIDSKYVVKSELPTITVEIVETQFYFEGSVTVDGVIITVKADKGVFPSDAVLNARRATKEEEAVAEDAVEEKRTAPNVAASYTFDIKILDKDGNELQPDTSKGKVKVAFTLEDARNENLEADIYHITDENPVDPQAEKLDTDNYASTVEAEATGFSFYTVEFTYGGYQYVLIGGTTILLSEILDVLGIEGTVVSATSSNESLFYARKYIINKSVQGVPMPYMEESPEGQWYLVSCQAFSSQEKLTLDMEDGSHYEIEVTDSAGVVGAHSDTNDGNVFLGGHYIEVGIAKTGSFGTSGAPKTEAGFHPVHTGNLLGLSVDKDGFGEGNPPTTCDFFLPGTEEERYIVAYRIDETTYENHNAERCGARWNLPKQDPTTKDESDITKGQLKATTTGITSEGVKMVTTISFGEEDYSFLTTVTLTNNTGKKITDLRWVRSFDPDQNAQISGGTYSTYNKVISNPNTNSDSTNQCAMVVAKGGTNKEAFFFAAFDERARASIIPSSLRPSSAYDDYLWKDDAKMPVEVREENYTGTSGYNLADVGIALTFNLGTLENGESTTLEYYSSLDPDVAHTFNALNGRINYNGETIDGFTPGTTYLITVYRDSKGKYYRVHSDANGSIMIEDTDMNGYEYSLFGKSIRVRELSEEAGIQYLDVNPRPVALDVNEAEDSIDSGSTTIKIALNDNKVGQEYRVYTSRGTEIAGQTWQNPTGKVLTLTGLEKNTSYILKAHVKATAAFPESKVSAGTILTTIGNDITVDYDDEVITGLKPHTIYEIVCGGGGGTGKPILVETDDKGEIPFEGEDEDGKPYDLTGEEIIIREPGSDDDGDDSPEIIKKKIDGRPKSDDVKPIDTGDPEDPDDTGAIAATGRTITICPAEKDQEYRIYDSEGKEIPGHGWVTSTKDGEVYKVVFKDLDYDKEYIVKTRIAAIDGKPASEPTDGTEVKTDDETDEDDIDVNYDDEVIEGLKPSTVYEVTEDTTEPKRWRKVYTNWKGRLPLRGKDLGPDGVLPTDDGEDYDFVGKTIEIREPKSEGGDEPTSIPTSIAGRPAPESIDPIDTGTPGGTGSEVDTRGTYIVVKPAIEKQEYRIYDKDGNEIEGRDWVKPTKEGGIPVVVFDGLEPETKYIIKTRIAASPEDNTPASEPSDGIEETTGEPGDDLDVDYEDETIGGLLPDTDYVIEYDDDNNPETPDKNIRVKTDEEGKLPIEGTDRTGNPYDLIGKKPVKFYKYPKKADSEPITKEFEGRPATSDPVTEVGTIGDSDTKGTSITVKPAEQDQEYRIYDKSGNEITGYGWVKPTKDGSTYTVVFEDLDYDKEYVIKTRKAPTSGKPGSEPTEGVPVKTDDVTDEDVDVDYEDEYIEGLKPNTEYDVYENESGTGGADDRGRRHRVRTDSRGRIPFTGKDEDDKDYDFTGTKIEILEPGKEDTNGIKEDIPDRPDNTGVKDAEEKDIESKGTSITIYDADPDQEYRIYDENGHEISGRDWTKPDEDGVVKFKDLDYNKRYIVKARKAPKSKTDAEGSKDTPGSEPSEGIEVTTGDKTDVTDVDIDYEDEVIEGLKPNTVYEITDRKTGKKHRVRTTRKGSIPFTGEDVDGEPYDITGEPISISEDNPDGTGTEPIIKKTVEDRPSTDDIEDIADDELKTKGKSITIRPADEALEYRIYDKDGNELPGEDWVKPDKDLVVIFDDLDYDTDYIIRARIAPTKDTPSSEPKDVKEVKTDDVRPDDVVIDYEDEEIEGLKPDTEYEIEYTSEDPETHELTKKKRKVRTDRHGRIPFKGEEVGTGGTPGPEYDLLDDGIVDDETEGDIKITESGSDKDPIGKDLGERPEIKKDGEDKNFTPPTSADTTPKGTTITINPAEPTQEYRVYKKVDDKLVEVTDQDWTKPTGGKVEFTDLDFGTEYIVKTRIAPTSEKPASLPFDDGVTVTTKDMDDPVLDYLDDEIGGFKPNTDYEVYIDDDKDPNTPDKKITVKTDKDGNIDIEGKDKDGQGYDLEGETIKVKEKKDEGEGAESDSITVGSRPTAPTPSITDITGDKGSGSADSPIVDDVKKINIYQESAELINLNKTNRNLEYQVYDEDGNEVGDWIKPDRDGNVLFTGLTKGKRYTIKARKPATESKPASTPTGVILTFQTNDEIDLDAKDGEEGVLEGKPDWEDILDGFKPNTTYEITDEETGEVYTVESDENGKIKVDGEDKDHKHFSFYGRKIRVRKHGSKDTGTVIEVEDIRPEAPTFDPEDWGTTGGTIESDTKKIKIYQKEIRITGLSEEEKELEYRVYGPDGEELPEYGWVKPSADGEVRLYGGKDEEGKLALDKMLLGDSEYTIKARKPATKEVPDEGETPGTPGVPASDAVIITKVKTDPVVYPEIDVREEVIDGCKPNTFYDITVKEGEETVTYTVKSDKDGDIILEGKDKDGKEFSLIGKDIVVKKSDTSDDYPKDDLKVPSRPEPIKFVEDEEAEVDVIDEDTEQVNLSESIIYINGLSGEKNDYEYCLFDEDGNEIPGMEWKMPEDGILVFEGLPSDTVYTIKARKPSTGKKFATLPVTTGLKIKTDISYVPVVNYDTDRIEGLKPEMEYDVWVGDDVYYLKTDENGGFTLKGVDYNGVEYNFEGQDLEIQINGKTEIKALSVPIRPETVPEEPIPTPTATSSGGGEGVSYPVIPKPEVVEEVLPEIAQEVAEETQTTRRRTAAVEEETEEIGKGNIIDRGDIWGDMSNETKQKLLDKLDESGGEIIKADDFENMEEVPVKDRPIAFVIGEGSVIVTIESTDTTRTNAGLKDSAAVAASILTPEQRAAVEAGSILEIRVEVTPLDEDAIPALDKQIMEEGLSSYAETMPDLVMADYVDISLYFRIDDSDWSQITDTEPIEIVIDIPDNYKGLSDTYYIMRAHQGEITLLEDLDDDIDTVTISTGQFSTYALMYEQHAAVAPIEKIADKCSLCHMCPTFLGICYFIWLAIFAAVAIGLVTFNTISKKSKKSAK